MRVRVPPPALPTGKKEAMKFKYTFEGTLEIPEEGYKTLDGMSPLETEQELALGWEDYMWQFEENGSLKVIVEEVK